MRIIYTTTIIIIFLLQYCQLIKITVIAIMLYRKTVLLPISYMKSLPRNYFYKMESLTDSRLSEVEIIARKNSSIRCYLYNWRYRVLHNRDIVAWLQSLDHDGYRRIMLYDGIFYKPYNGKKIGY